MTQQGRRLALIIASSEFTDQTLQKLAAPAYDAADLAGVLEDPEIGRFEVKVLTDRPSHEVRREIDVFFADRKRDDLLLLYVSSHGIKDNDGRLYLATIDTERVLCRSTAVPATFVNETMQASNSRRQVLILDCCYSGAFARGMVVKGVENVDIKAWFEGRGRVVLTASSAIQYAFEENEVIGEDSRSVFTRHMVRGLETGEADLNGNGWISLDELYEYVHERVTHEIPQQTPSRWNFDLQGDINIARNPLAARVAEQYAEGLPGDRDALERVVWLLRRLIAEKSKRDASVQAVATGPEKRALWQDILTELRETLAGRFNASELRTLCFDLGVDYDDLPGQGNADKARELVSYLDRRDRIHKLGEIGKRARPDILWDNFFQAPHKRLQRDEALFICLHNDRLVLSYLREAILAGLDVKQLSLNNLGDMLEQVVQQIIERDSHLLLQEYEKVFSAEELGRLLSYLGWYMVNEGITRCDATKDARVIEEVLNELQKDQYTVEQVLNWLSTSYWIRKTISDKFEFRDSYVIDIFAAIELKKSAMPSSALLGLQREGDPVRWSKVIVLLSGMLSANRAIELIEELLKAGSIQLAGWCIAEGQAMPQAIVARVIHELETQLEKGNI